MNITKFFQFKKVDSEPSLKTALPLIVNMMGEYFKKEVEKSNSSLLSLDKVKEKYNRLTKLGLSNSVNACELKTIIDNQTVYNESIIKARNLIEYIKKVNSILNKNSYLISFEQFEQVCQKYNLVYNLLENYTGVIPEENIIQLENISNKISEIPDINEDLYLVSEVEISGESKSFANWVKDKRILHLPSLDCLKFGHEIWSSDINMDYPDCPIVEFPALNYVRANKLTNTTFLIAAPESHFKDNFKITINEDPIVFQICPYGCLIHSVWGEETNDVVLERYRKTLEL
jgi:hypothetical protein